MSNKVINFLRGTKEKFNLENTPPKNDGQLIFVDDGSIYMDKTDSLDSNVINRIQMGGKEILEKSFNLPLSDISNNQITITSNNFFQSNNYSYIISPAEISYDEYINCGGRAVSVSNNTMTLIFKEKPTKDLKINIIRFEVKSNV